MFEPLLFQIIHYVTQSSKLNQQGTKALLASLLDATAHVQNSAIRDLAVRCLREFLQWTNRQSGGSTLSTNERLKIKCTVLDQLKTNALESNASHRYGSALAFNNLYRLLLQEEYHVIRYSFELMHSYAIGLLVTEEHNGFAAEAFGSGDGAVVEQFLLALEHMGKLFEERKATFNPCEAATESRAEHRQIVPPAIGGGMMEHLVRWLFRQCAARQRLYRGKCMQLFPRLARTVQNVTDGEDFLDKHFTREQIEGICLQVDAVQGIDRAPTIVCLREDQTAGSLVMNIYLWLEYFLATLDMYCWLQRENLVGSELARVLRCRILPTLQYFLHSAVHSSVYEIMLQIKPDESHESRTRMNAEKIVQFDTLKAAVVVQIVDLFILLASSEERTVLALWQENATIEFVLALLFRPHKLGLDFNVPVLRELENDRRFWKKLDLLLLQLVERSNHTVGQRFANALAEKLIQVMESLGDRMQTLLTQRTIAVDDQRSAKGMLFVAKQQRNRARYKTLVSASTRARIEQTAGKLLSACFEAIAQDGVRFVLSPSAARFGSVVLQAIFTLPDAVEPGVKGKLLNATVTHCLNVNLLQPNIRHGEHFLVCFGPAVYELFFANPAECFDALFQALGTEHNFSSIVRMCCEMLDYSYRVHASDTEQLRRVTEILLSGWTALFENSRQQSNQFGSCDVQMIELMSSVAMICPFPLNEIRLKAGPTYERWLAELIGQEQLSAKVSIGLKTKAIVLLPTVLGIEVTSELGSCYETALERLQTLHFPLRSSEFPPNSPERIALQNCLERLLDALVVSRSPLLLKAIVQMTAPDGEGNIAETQIRNAMERFFADQSMEMQCARLKELWELFDNHSYAPAVRSTILRRYLCTGLWHCRYDTVVEFYRQTIRSISSYSGVEINGRSGWVLEHALVDRAASFRLMEHYAALLPKTVLMRENCPVALELYGPALDSSAPVRGQRLIGDFSKRAHGVRRVAFRGENRTATELFRKYQCAAYRALVALISNTNDDPRMYSVLLFRESRDKGEYLWRHLVDCSDDNLYLEASQDQEETPRTMEKRVAIRREAGGDTAPPPPSRPPGYNDPGRSVVLESSLSQQVFRFDLHHAVILSARELAERDAAELVKRQKGTLSNVPLERTRINEHEIMATVCGCVRHMAASKIALDAVVQFLATSLADAGQPKNVRLFLGKVVDNCRHELKPHCAILLGPLMQLIVDERIFRGLNPLVTDLIALVLEWNVEPRRTPRAGSVDENASLASVLLRFVMRHTCRQEGTAGGGWQQVFRLNMELIKEIIAQWHDKLTVPGELLFETISTEPTAQGPERSQFQTIAGLQLGTSVLVNGRGNLVPWMESTRLEYLRAVLHRLDAPISSIYKPAALLLGHCLAHLYPSGFPEDSQSESEQETFHTECIAKFSHIQRAQGRKCVDLLYETAKAFPSIADPFLSIVSFRIPGAAGPEKRMCLELLLGGRLEKFGEELFRELASMELALLLRDGDLQLPTLHLLNRALPLVGELQQLQQLVEPVGHVAMDATTPPECRAVAYEILIYIHESRGAELTQESKTSVWRYLMHGLCTADEAEASMTSVRARILEYLTDAGRLPKDLKDRFLYLLAELYEPSVEAEFLGTAVALLLDPAVRCREAKDRIFLHEYLNADVKFTEYSIETGARKRHTMTLLTPMFAESSTQRQLQSFIGRGSQMEQIIRATQFAGVDRATLDERRSAFEPTQDPAWLTKGRETFVMPTQHSLLFETGSLLQLDRRSQRTVVAGNSPMTPEAASHERSFERLRKRILKDSETSRERQTAWAIGKHYSSQRQRAEQRRESSSKVTLYRRYRLADYPDLQINLLAFLLPLQALCRRDKACARHTFVAIYNGLVESLSASDTAENRSARTVEWDRFVERVDHSMHRILDSMKTCDPNLFGGLVELTLGKASGRFTLPPRTVASVAGTSNMLTMGVLYLEDKLANGDDFDGEPVRTGPGRGSSEAEHWLQLSTLYHTLHEHSVVAGIFGEKQDSDPGLRDAIELEALGRYDRAHRAYCELISRISPARVEERNFCYRSAFNCLLQLGQWDVLLEEIGSQVSNHEELWSDEWNQENMLPSYMHGNVRLNLAGDESGRTFCHILEQWMHIPAREEHIRQHFGEELTALQVACGEMVRARLFGEQVQRQFLDEWHCAGVLSEQVRAECLFGVRKAVELIAYSELLELEAGSGKLEQAIDGLAHSWRHAQPLVTDTLGTWDTIVAYRRFLLTKLEPKCPAQSISLDELSSLLFDLDLQLLEVAFEQNNVRYAGKLINRLRHEPASTSAREPRMDQVLRHKIARARYNRIRQTKTATTLIGGFQRLAQILSHISCNVMEERGLEKVKQMIWTELSQYGETIRQLASSSSGEDIRPEESTQVLEIVRTAIGHEHISAISDGTLGLRETLKQFSLQCLQRSIDTVTLSDQLDVSDKRDRQNAALELAEAHLRLARYCYDELDPERDEQEELPVERSLVTSLLPAIRHGSPEARHMFPVLLQLRNLQNNALQREFQEFSGSVPSWNFLPWIPQLLSHMKTNGDETDPDRDSSGHFLDELLMRLAQEYPRALYFPARVVLSASNQPPRPFMVRLRNALSSPVLDRFVKELFRVVMPATLLRGMLMDVKSHLNGVTDPDVFKAFIERAIARAFPRDANDCRQAYRAAMPTVDKFRSLLTLHPTNDRVAILAKLQELETDVQSMRPRAKTQCLQLKDFSPWLADYHSSGQDQRGITAIEVPGQYTADRGPPNPAHHVTVVKVVPHLLAYSTLRLPVLLSFRGSDGRQHRFLAKFGEDLRQDQRIQQLQREITHRLRWDRRCREQRLEIRTYQVVPISPSFGLFGWLEGTVALSEIATQAGPRYNPGNRGQTYVYEEYKRFLLSVAQQEPTVDAASNASTYNMPSLYGTAAALCLPVRLQSKYVELSQTMRENTLKRALYDMAASPESFYRLRMNFAKSLAAMNVTCWALGIGDRHLSNIVLEQSTGTLVGVDFGIAFGAGTRDLSVPELVPFRLTPQFVGVMEPMRLAGMLQKYHLYTLQCLRDARRLLRACLEVFVREPTVDWLKAARQRTEERPSSHRADRAWNPRERVDMVLRKLNGANPKQLLANELRFGAVAQQREFLVGYLALVNASSPVSQAKVEAGGGGATKTLSTELQMEMLLEMATDRTLLGITYHGWYPWF
uniref:non-specific serine/threonine protein kinase n=1 Tax=Anopheles farauti TaxID=69004 RepID=A0A182QNF4_9DIPT